MSKRTWTAIGLTVLLAVASSASPASATPPPPEEIIRREALTRTLNLSSIAAAQQATTVPANMREDFESSWPGPGWIVMDESDTDGGQYAWGRRNCHPRSGDYAAWSVGGGTEGSALDCGDHYPNNADAWALYGPFNLRDAVDASLTFHMWGRTAPSSADWPDGLYVGSSAGGPFELEVHRGGIVNGNEGNGYHRHTLDLSNRLGESEVWIAFGFISDAGGTDYGMMIDDVTLASSGLAPSFDLGWSSAALEKTNSVAWGDYDADGDLDLAAANSGGPACVFRNDGGTLLRNAVWSSSETDQSQSVAWGDVDGDGDLDLAVGNEDEPNRLYRNEGGTLTTTAIWSSNELDSTYSVAWGDIDGDGDLDLAVGNRWAEPTRLYRNNGGVLTSSAVWSSSEANYAQSVAWGDYDNDGDLDLAVGNFHQTPNRLYRNEGGSLTSSAVWESAETDHTYSVAWGDPDNDGDLDLMAGNGSVPGYYLSGVPNRLYRNDGGTLTTSAVWSSSEADWTTGIAWGDFDSDGDPDLAVANRNSVRLYRNDSGTLTPSASWTAAETNYGEDLAWADFDGDGDLDLAVANWEQPNRVYRNDGRPLERRSVWTSTGAEDTLSVAWGDPDTDGDLDLATGNRGPNRLYYSDAGTLSTTANWTSTPDDWANSIAWGDFDGDGDLDLAVGNGGHVEGDPNAVYRNDGGTLNPNPVWTSSDVAWTNDVAWGDVDGDGDLDLVAGNQDAPNGIYRNDGDVLTTAPAWTSAESDHTSSVAWGDVDGDGDLDLAVGNGSWLGTQPNRLYLNDGTTLREEAVWSSSEDDDTRSVAWGDVDGDGELDLMAGNRGPNRLYRNQGGALTASAVWASNEADATNSIVWADYDGDGDLDLGVGNYWNEPNRLYRNDGGTLTANAIWSSAEEEHTSSVAFGDYDHDGDLDLVSGNEQDQLQVGSRPNRRIHRNTRDNIFDEAAIPVVSINNVGAPGDADHYASPQVWSDPTVSFTYTLFHRDSDPVREVRGYYSLDGGGRWLPAIATADTVTTNLASAPYPDATPGNTHVYRWDVLSSGVMGQYDNVRFRLVAIPKITHEVNDIAGPYQYGSYSATTFPFRVRGSQVRVMNGTHAVANALVYRLPARKASDGAPYADAGGVPFKTNTSGYLQGHGEIGVGDRLLALAPITQTPAYRLYYTNGDPTSSGVEAYAVTSPGAQTLEVSADHPLYLFNLDVSLEWDAHNDDAFMEKLEYDLRRAAEQFYDFTDGQATLGEVYVFHDAENWQTAHMRIYANNRLRPNAAVGGIVTDTITDTQVPTVTYQVGQIRMPATWNRYGDPSSGGIGEDWPRTLAHEMGHYYLFLDDHYLGLNEEGEVVSIDACTDTAMTDPYRYSEYRDQANWLPACEDTMANHLTGRSDWETISVFYPYVTGPDERGANSGPVVTPFDFTEITAFEPLTPTQAIADPTFYFLNEAGQRYQPADGTRGFLIKDDTWLVDVGEPIVDHILARGAQPGDRLCVFDAARSYQGCETIALGDDQMVLHGFPEWHPEILVSPISTNTVSVTVHTADALTLHGQVFSTDGPATEPFNFVKSPAGTYTAVATSSIAEALLMEGLVHIWVDEAAPRREMITDYSIGSSPGAVRGHGGAVRGHGGAVRGHGGAVRGHGGAVRGHGAPILSGDGQLTVYTPDPTIPEGEFLTIQAATGVPDLPAGRVQIGQGYRIAATAGLTNLDESSLSFQYRGEAVPAGMEEDITIYRWDEGTGTWQTLPTKLNTWDNFASASMQGSGLYTLLTAFQVPLPAAGWNLFSYPLRESQPVTQALASVSGAYATVYGYAASDDVDPWKMYDVNVPHYANDLEHLSFGQGYWISATQPITAYFGSSSVQSTVSPAALPPQVPATYYGAASGGRAGQTITAWVGDALCGNGQIFFADGNPVFSLNVLAEEGGPAGCGAPGRQVTFRVDSQVLSPTVAWDNRRPREVPLQIAGPVAEVYLPLVIKGR